MSVTKLPTLPSVLVTELPTPTTSTFLVGTWPRPLVGTGGVDAVGVVLLAQDNTVRLRLRACTRTSGVIATVVWGLATPPDNEFDALEPVFRHLGGAVIPVTGKPSQYSHLGLVFQLGHCAGTQSSIRPRHRLWAAAKPSTTCRAACAGLVWVSCDPAYTRARPSGALPWAPSERVSYGPDVTMQVVTVV